jgi:hypothetical protein
MQWLHDLLCDFVSQLKQQASPFPNNALITRCVAVAAASDAPAPWIKVFDDGKNRVVYEHPDTHNQVDTAVEAEEANAIAVALAEEANAIAVALAEARDPPREWTKCFDNIERCAEFPRTAFLEMRFRRRIDDSCSRQSFGTLFRGITE